MSLLTPERVPVKVYKWDDAGAPALDKTAGCVATIFKACLVTGYGTKEGAGWTMPFEEVSAGVKVLRPEASPHTDFYLRLSADTGTEVLAQIYLNMTDANTGDLKLQCDSPFRAAKKSTAKEWLIVASTRGVWFFVDNGTPKQGSYFFAGDLIDYGSVGRGVYLQHTGGSSDSGNVYKDMLHNLPNYTNGYVQGRLLYQDSVTSANPVSFADAKTQKTIAVYATPLVLFVGKVMLGLPGIHAAMNGAALENLSQVTIANGSDVVNAVVFGASTDASNFYITTDGWVY